MGQEGERAHARATQSKTETQSRKYTHKKVHRYTHWHTCPPRASKYSRRGSAAASRCRLSEFHIHSTNLIFIMLCNFIHIIGRQNFIHTNFVYMIPSEIVTAYIPRPSSVHACARLPQLSANGQRAGSEGHGAAGVCKISGVFVVMRVCILCAFGVCLFVWGSIWYQRLNLIPESQHDECRSHFFLPRGSLISTEVSLPLLYVDQKG